MSIKIMFLIFTVFIKYIGISLGVRGLILTYKNGDVDRAMPCLAAGVILLELYCLYLVDILGSLK